MVTSDSNVIALAHTTVIQQNAAASILKTDSNGAIDWQVHKLINFTSWVKGVTYSDGSFIVGLTNSASSPNYVTVAKFDVAGSIIWQRKLNFLALQYITSICEGSNNSVLVTGRTKHVSSSINDFWTAQIDSSGVLLNSHQYHLPVAGFHTWPSNMIAVDGGAIALGRYASIPATTSYPVIFKFDSTGALIWNKIYRDMTISPFPCYVEENSTGELFFYFGFKSDTIFLWKTNSTGNSIWLKQFNYTGASGGNFLIKQNDEIIVMNNLSDFNGTGVNFIALDGNCNVLRSHYYPDYYGRSCAELPDGRIVFAGYTNTFDSQILGFLGPSEQLSCAISTQNFSLIDIQNSLPDSVIFNDVNQGTDQQGYLIHYPLFIYDSIFCRLDSSVAIENISLFNTEFYFSSEHSTLFLKSDFYSEMDFKFYDLNGKLIHTIDDQTIIRGTNAIPVNCNFIAGMYLISADGENFHKVLKILIP